MTSKAIAECMKKSGLCVCPNFLSAAEISKLCDDFDYLYAQGEFYRAGIGQGARQRVDAEIRKDEIYWLNRTQETAAQRSLWLKLDLLKRAFNRNLYLGLTDFEGHYASYPVGGFYHRHVDVFQNDSARQISLVIYLNQDWQSSDGGRLRIFAGEQHIDVDPLGGTLVCFMSRDSEHEVLPSFRRRLSFTGWFKTGSTVVQSDRWRPQIPKSGE